ncbi:MAG: propanoyl-CoA acyltransferase [Deltaproteobacteria bacterium HGW-Deltaproteobacteria-12]|jgi:acetyl-CoA C-acetyltransferase|nr:MAG: propanoyl-CoA acyltransferase [Deltaproteobacteria bacterium HGW-Deltaproteobacteria-12]
MDKAAIVGVAQTKYEKRKKEQIFADMVFDVTREALDDAGLTIKDIDNVVTVSNDFYDGRTISGMAVGDACGAEDKNVSTVSGDGSFGAFYGLMRVLSGYKAAIVVAHYKGSEGNVNITTNGMFDPIFHRHLGLDAISSAALQANAYMTRYGISEEDVAKVSVKNHGNAKNNPYAQLPLEITVADVMKSRKIAEPLKLLDCCPNSDGAAAIIIVNEEMAGKCKKKPVWIKGVSHCCEDYFLGDRDLANPVALAAAAKRAYAMAGIGNPAEEISVAEILEPFSYMEPLWLEGLGICQPGEGGKLIDQGITVMGGKLPVNPSGGALSANPILVAGLARLIEASLQVRGEAGSRQVKKVNNALAHGFNGPCGQSHCVWIVSGNK